MLCSNNVSPAKFSILMACFSHVAKPPNQCSASGGWERDLLLPEQLFCSTRGPCSVTAAPSPFPVWNLHPAYELGWAQSVPKYSRPKTTGAEPP